MNSNREEAFLRSDLDEVTRLLEDVPVNHVLERLSLQARRNELTERLAKLPARHSPLAAIDVVFRGQPVLGATGVDAKFGVKALDAFQRGLHAAAASHSGEALGQRGPLPETSSRMLLTDVIHGSFGFRFEEVTGEPDMFEGTSMSKAVDDVTSLLAGLTGDAELFADAAGDVDPRVIASLREFINVVASSGATFRVASPSREVNFGSVEKVQSAKEHLASYKVTEDLVPFPGTFLGILPVGRRFEHQLEDGSVIRGRIGRDIDDPFTLREWEGRHATIYARVVSVDRPDNPVPPRYTLRRIEG